VVKAAVLYWSKTGTTEKVARAIAEGLGKGGADVLLQHIRDASDLDFYAYDLVCVGAPSYRWRPPEPVNAFLTAKFNAYSGQGRVKVGAPQVPGKHALVFCTYSGPHTGIDEAIPAGKCMGQYFAHLGFEVLDEWYVVGEFHGSEESSTLGRLGDIRGRPNEQDLAQVVHDAEQLVERIQLAR
jgi:flavorubredoxin